MTASSSSAAPQGESLPIGDRLNSRLALAAKAVDRRLGAARPKKRNTASRTLASLQDEAQVEQRELMSLRSVFSELGEAHRRYRAQTGKPGTPELRAAAHAFKESPSRDSLLPVAELLDNLQILAW